MHSPDLITCCICLDVGSRRGRCSPPLFSSFRQGRGIQLPSALPSGGIYPRSMEAVGRFPQLRPRRLPPTGKPRLPERREPASQADPSLTDLNMQPSPLRASFQRRQPLICCLTAGRFSVGALVWTRGLPRAINRSAWRLATLHLIKNAPIPQGGSLELIDGGSKVVMMNGDILKAQASRTGSIDAIVSFIDTISE